MFFLTFIRYVLYMWVLSTFKSFDGFHKYVLALKGNVQRDEKELKIRLKQFFLNNCINTLLYFWFKSQHLKRSMNLVAGVLTMFDWSCFAFFFLLKGCHINISIKPDFRISKQLNWICQSNWQAPFIDFAVRHEPWATSFTSYKLWATSYELQVTSYKIWKHLRYQLQAKRYKI
jgi:hypothetical protein